jgi:hypothetical protein
MHDSQPIERWNGDNLRRSSLCSHPLLLQIYAFCEQRGRLAWKPFGASYLITDGKYWQNQVRREMYDQRNRFKR